MKRRTPFNLLLPDQAIWFYYCIPFTIKGILPFFILFFVLSCHPISSNTTPMDDKKKTNKTLSKNKTPQTSESGKTILTGPIIRKKFQKKNGKYSDKEELYLRASVQDYFIKFCSSHVKKEALESYLKETKLPDVMGDKVVSLEVEIVRDGFLDICDFSLDQMPQSRKGDFINVSRIVSK